MTRDLATPKLAGDPAKGPQRRVRTTSKKVQVLRSTTSVVDLVDRKEAANHRWQPVVVHKCCAVGQGRVCRVGFLRYLLGSAAADSVTTGTWRRGAARSQRGLFHVVLRQAPLKSHAMVLPELVKWLGCVPC